MNRIKIGIVGLNFGRHIVSQLQTEPGSALFEIAAMCDLDVTKASALAGPLSAKVYSDLDELLADDSIPAIGLFTGPAGRADLVRKIVRAGKDVMTTKPFEVDSQKGLAVLKEARELGRVVHLNSPSPLAPPDLKQIEQWRDELQLGRPIGCRIDTWATYREQADGGWYDDPEKCPVAPIFRLGIYLINDLIRLLGKPEAVQVLHSRVFTGRPTPDNAQLGIRFKNGSLANVFASFCIDDDQYYSNAMTLNFENGTIYRNIGRRIFNHDPEAVELSVIVAKPERRVERATVSESSGGYQWEAFHRAINGEKLEGEISPEEIVAGLKVIEAMSRAEKSGALELVS
jgi:predicted dehydrogenase